MQLERTLFETGLLAIGVSVGMMALVVLSFWTLKWMVGKWTRGNRRSPTIDHPYNQLRDENN